MRVLSAYTRGVRQGKLANAGASPYAGKLGIVSLAQGRWSPSMQREPPFSRWRPFSSPALTASPQANAAAPRRPPMRIVRVMQLGPGVPAGLPGMDFSRGPDHAGDRRGLRQGDSRSQRPALAGSCLLGRRLSRRRGGDGPAHQAEGLVVAVARTLIEKCPARARACPEPQGQAITGASDPPAPSFSLAA